MSLQFRRHYRLLVLLVLVLAGCTLALGDVRIIAYTVAGNRQVATAGADYGSQVDLFDQTVVHSIQITIDEADYQQMITTYQETGVKDYSHADVVIDGTLVRDVGLRLKGNASLRTALGGRGGPGMGFGPGNMPFPEDGRLLQPPDGGQWQPPAGVPPESLPARGDGVGRVPQPPDGGEWQPPAASPQEGQERAERRPPAGDMPPGGMWAGREGAGEAGAKVPLLIKFDEFVPGQTYQGLDRLAVRTYGTSPDAALLQEPVTNAVAAAAGLPATRTAYAGVRLNDGQEQLFTLSEVIGDDYLAQHLAYDGGVLYKSDLGADLSYQGEDPSAYATRFTQQTRVNDADLAPLIALARFVSESDDEAFQAGLARRLDVEGFATYLAVNNLLVNVDSMAGMSNNYYLYYDDVAERFTVLLWDANESLGKLAGGGRAATYDLYYQGRQGMGGGRGGMERSNTLVTRFLAAPTFRALYEAKLVEIYDREFAGGAIDRRIEEYADLVRTAAAERTGLVDLEQYEQAVVSLQAFVEQRAAYVASTELLAGQTSAVP